MTKLSWQMKRYICFEISVFLNFKKWKNEDLWNILRWLRDILKRSGINFCVHFERSRRVSSDIGPVRVSWAETRLTVYRSAYSTISQKNDAVETFYSLSRLWICVFQKHYISKLWLQLLNDRTKLTNKKIYWLLNFPNLHFIRKQKWRFLEQF